jgi:Fe2+ transport system protein FeoA
MPEPVAVPARASTTLATLPDRTPAVVEAIAAGEAAELAFEGLGAGSSVEVTARAPFGGPVIVRSGRARIALPRRVAEAVTVQPADEGG